MSLQLRNNYLWQELGDLGRRMRPGEGTPEERNDKSIVLSKIHDFKQKITKLRSLEHGNTLEKLDTAIDNLIQRYSENK